MIQNQVVLLDQDSCSLSSCCPIITRSLRVSSLTEVNIPWNKGLFFPFHLIFLGGGSMIILA